MRCASLALYVLIALLACPPRNLLSYCCFCWALMSVLMDQEVDVSCGRDLGAAGGALVWELGALSWWCSRDSSCSK